MKTFITALISCSLMLGAIAMAQQDEEQQKGKKGKKSQQTSQTQAQPQATATGAQRGTKRGQGTARHEQHAPMTANTPAATENANAQEGGKHKGKRSEHGEGTNPAATENANANANVQEGGKHKGKRGEHAEGTSPAATENTNANANVQEGGKQKGKRSEAAMKTGSPGPAANAGTSAGSANAKIKSGTVGKNGKTVDVQKIKGQHTNFRAQARPQQIKSVTFNQNYRIVNAERWQGPQYEVFRTYQPAWHDSGWYRSNFAQVALIGGGYYYFNSGYWYPAWGYDPAAQYYAYDAPIYVGSAARPPDQVIADVQAELQDMGYYHGEVDGLLGPLTREALTAYQSDHGLYATAVIDQPTLDAMGMS